MQEAKRTGKGSTSRKESTKEKLKSKIELKRESFNNVKYRAYCMLYDVMMHKEKILKHIDLPKYRIPWIRVP